MQTFRHLILLAVPVFLAACGGSADHNDHANHPPASETVSEYTVRGEVIELKYEGQAVRVHHENIPGYMDAMRMDFRGDPDEIATLQPGERIRFQLVVTEGGQHRIRGVERLADTTRLDFHQRRTR